MLIENEVEVGISGNIKYYESLGYEIPKHINYGKIFVPRGTKIKVKVQDLLKHSNVRVHCTCDYPGCDKILEWSWECYNYYNHEGKTYCNSHASALFNSGENNSRYNPNLTDEERNNKRKSTEYCDFTKKSACS